MTDQECAEVLRRYQPGPGVPSNPDWVDYDAAVERAIELLEWDTHLFDTRYLCTKGHHVVSKQADLDTCSAELPWPRTEETTVCGAQLHVYQEDWADA